MLRSHRRTLDRTQLEEHIMKMNDPGWPRPFAMHFPWVGKGTKRHSALEGKRLPIPWSQDVSADGLPSWGHLDLEAQQLAESESRCLVCGEVVDEGVVLTYGDHSLESYTREDLARRPASVADSGPMHDRCWKLTLAYCPHIRDDALKQLGKKEYSIRPYRKQAS